MCGIVGYIGSKTALPILLEGLKRLEYRGYDSAGLAFSQPGQELLICKRAGKIVELEKYLQQQGLTEVQSTAGIGHTRWATHGEPTDINAHPHLDCLGKIAVVHNGIIENYRILKEWLVKQGHVFKSDTDTEVVAHLIEEMKGSDLLERVLSIVEKLEGTYGLLIVSSENPGEIIAVRNGSPVSLGYGDGENYVASDSLPFVGMVTKVQHLMDGQAARLTPESVEIFDFKKQQLAAVPEELTLSLEQIAKGGYDHFMLKEIFEQPRSIADTMAGRVYFHENSGQYDVNLGGIADYQELLSGASNIIITACGTSWHAGRIGEILFEHLARIPTEVKYASELISLDHSAITPGSVAMAITQSGETKDTDEAIKLLQKRGVSVFGICNVVGSTIARRCGKGVYTHAGPEIGVASTKAFTAQVITLVMMSLIAGKINGSLVRRDIEWAKIHPNFEEGQSWSQYFLKELANIPGKIQQILDRAEEIKKLAEIFSARRNFLFLGRGINYPVALEGALKLKEISYVHAEGYPAGEMKHGPIALIDEDMPSLVILPNNDHAYQLIYGNIKEIKSRKGVVIAIALEGDESAREVADYIFYVPPTSYLLLPLLTVIPLQLLAYYIAVKRGCEVDQPRNLAKAVTVH